MKNFPSRSILWIACIALLLTVSIPTFMVLHQVRAAGIRPATERISASPLRARPTQNITVNGSGFKPNCSGELEFENGVTYSLFTCDANGNFKTTIASPAFLTGGQYPLTAYDGTGASAQTYVTIVPAIYVSPSGGGAGTAISVNGSGFNSSEVVQVYWYNGTTRVLIGSATATSWGTLGYTFNAPLKASKGLHTIQVVRTITPRSLKATFAYTPPQLIAPATVQSGKQMNVQVTGFARYDSVTVSWNANGGQILAMFGIDQNGQGYRPITVPTTPEGKYTLTVTSNQSGLVVQKPITVV